MFIKSAQAIKKDRIDAQHEQRAFELTRDFIWMLDSWHSIPEPFDPKLEAYFLQTRAEIILNPVELDEKRYFTPSSANSCPRELFHRLRGDQRDDFDIQPHQGRWQRMGTAFGDMIQRDLLYIHKHFERINGTKPPFIPKYVELDLGGSKRKVPYWEDFAKKTMSIVHDGVEINLMGQPDGILRYRDGSTIGLEIKSKQTSYSRTSQFSMKEADISHVKQVVAYSLLYGIDEFIILYGNLAKKDWVMDYEEYVKYPDIRAFYVKVTEDDKRELLDKFAEVVKAVKENKPPKLDLDKWTFNRYKLACAKSLTADEIKEIEEKLADIREEISKLELRGKKVPNELRNKAQKLEHTLDFIMAHWEG